MSVDLAARALWPRPWAGPPVAGGRIAIAGGRIAAVEPGEPVGDDLLVPGLVNAHDHGRGLRPLADGAADAPLEEWLWDVRRAPRVDPYLAHLVAFGRMALSGVTTVVHNHLPQGPDLCEEARAVARAAREVGLRLAFVAPVLDRNLVGYDGGGAVFAALDSEAAAELSARDRQPPFAEQIAGVAAIAAAIDGPGVVTQFGPPGLQWLSDAGLSAVGASAGEQNRRVHVHLLETEAQRRWLDAAHPYGAAQAFARFGLLDQRLTLAHGVWLRPAEIAAFAEAGATLVLNPSSNLRLRSGVAPAADLAASGIDLGLGLDGLALDDDEDMLREVRLAATLFAPRGLGAAGLAEAAILRAAFSTGRRAYDGTAAPGLAAGAPADVVALSLSALAVDRVLDNVPEALAALALGRWRRAAVRDVWVDGRRIVADGRLAGVDLGVAEAELTAAARVAFDRAPPPAWIARGRSTVRAAAAGVPPR